MVWQHNVFISQYTEPSGCSPRVCCSCDWPRGHASGACGGEPEGRFYSLARAYTTFALPRPSGHALIWGLLPSCCTATSSPSTHRLPPALRLPLLFQQWVRVFYLRWLPDFPYFARLHRYCGELIDTIREWTHRIQGKMELTTNRGYMIGQG